MKKIKLNKGHAYRQAGFTLIELLVVIAIIGILATLLILQLNTARSKGRDAKRITDINQLQTAIEQYFDDNGSYPADITDALIGKYMQSGKAPLDPQGGQYGYGLSGSKYQVSAGLENKNSSALGGDVDISVASWLPRGKDGTKETCAATPTDCIFDLGIQ